MAAPSGPARPEGTGALRALLMLTLLLLIVQYLVGMVVNLWAGCFPHGTMHVFTADSCGSQPYLEAHVLLGVLLGLLALVLVIWAAVRKSYRALGPLVGGLLGVLLGAVGGYEYLATAALVDSFLMALGFLLAVGAYSAASVALRGSGRGGAALRWTPPSTNAP